ADAERGRCAADRSGAGGAAAAGAAGAGGSAGEGGRRTAGAGRDGLACAGGTGRGDAGRGALRGEGAGAGADGGTGRRAPVRHAPIFDASTHPNTKERPWLLSPTPAGSLPLLRRRPPRSASR